MDLGKPVKVVTIPERVPARQPVEQPQRNTETERIPLPADWPVRSPIGVPEKAGRSSTDR